MKSEKVPKKRMFYCMENFRMSNVTNWIVILGEGYPHRYWIYKKFVNVQHFWKKWQFVERLLCLYILLYHQASQDITIIVSNSMNIFDSSILCTVKKALYRKQYRNYFTFSIVYNEKPLDDCHCNYWETYEKGIINILESLFVIRTVTIIFR